MVHKLSLAFTPTPTHRLTELSHLTGIDLWIKRDDLTGDIATGGNKIRKLEYILADALEQGADVVMTTGGPQSNHAKATAALAVKAGLKPVLVFAGEDPHRRDANLFIDQLVGAEIQFSGARTPEEMEQALETTSMKWRQKGFKPYVIPIGGSNGLGTLGYMDAYEELGKHDFDWIVLTAGSGGTYAGILLANELYDRADSPKTKVLGISPWLPQDQIKLRIERCMQQTIKLLPQTHHYSLYQRMVNEPAGNLPKPLLDDRYIGRGYGKLTAEAQEAMTLVAQKEAIILDHVYTGKAMAGLLDYIQKGIIKPKEKVLFWHTGGAPGLLSITDQWTE